MVLLGFAGFSDRTYPSGKRSDGVRSEKSAGCLNVGVWNVSTSKDWAYVCFSFQTPIRASEFRSERQFDLFVSVKWNVDAVQSIGDERL